MTAVVVTQEVTKVICSAGANFGTAGEGPPIRMTNEFVKALSVVSPTTTLERVTQMVAKALSTVATTTLLRVTQLVIKTLPAAGPDLSWLDMFYEIRFPEDISWSSEGGPGYLTDVLTVKSGVDQRISRWDLPLYSFDASYGVKTVEQLHAVHRIFHAVNGQFGGFRFKDWLDYRSFLATEFASRDDPMPVNTDQFLGLGDDVTTTFQLQKLYEFGGIDKYRIITKPVAGTTIVAVNGIGVTNWTVDTTTGIVTFIPRYSITNTITKAEVQSDGLHITFLATSGTPFSGFLVGDRVQVSGFAHDGLNTMGIGEWYTITHKDVGGTYIIVSAPAYTTGSRFDENAGQSVTINVHPAPNSYDDVTAGFEFDVPVRFAVDKLPTRLDSFGIGSIQSIPLMEVRKPTQ